MIESKVLSFTEFRQFLSDSLGIAEAALTPEAHFLNDLAIESLKLVELIVPFETQLGVHIPTDAAWEIQTVGDAFKYYVELARNGSGAGSISAA